MNLAETGGGEPMAASSSAGPGRFAMPDVGGEVVLALVLCAAVAAVFAARSRASAAKPLAELAATSAVAAARIRRESGMTVGGHVVVVNAEPCRPRKVVYANDAEPTPFESNVCKGLFTTLHRPTDDPELERSGDYPHAAHFKGRKRLWEFRMQFTFNQELEEGSSIFFGVEQDQYYKVGRSQRYMASILVSALKSAAPGLYQSYGDDPDKIASGKEVERPHMVFPLWLMDQLIVTEAGAEAPELGDPEFSKLGLTKAQNRRKFQAAISELRFKPGPTYTFGFWCIAQYCDTLLWRAPGRGLLPEQQLKDIGIHPPGYLAVYVLKAQDKDEKKPDPRHFDSRKTYIWRAAFWSSHLPPTRQRQRQLVDDKENRRDAEHPGDSFGPNTEARSRWCCG